MEYLNRMYFAPFNVNTTNIFPAANTTQGGQLCTEFNLRSIDSVSTDPDVKYMYGPSFVHSVDEFALRYDEGKGNSVITITAGRAVVNGHYVESLADIDIDIAEGNKNIVSNGGHRLSGKLVVGLVALYSEATTLNGELDKDDNYLGVQIVVVPESEFCLPGDTEQSKTSQDYVTAHIKLGSFNYTDRIQRNTVTNNDSKIQFIDADRIYNLEDYNSEYFKKTGLVENQLYCVSAKFDHNAESMVSADFCKATDSLMVWDTNPLMLSQLDPNSRKCMQKLMKDYKSAGFAYTEDGQGVQLVVPHKQVDNNATITPKNTSYAPILLNLPVADLIQKTPGIVNAAYSKVIDRALSKINEFYNIPNGKYLKYIDSLSDRKELPPINGADHSPGDYIVVRQDTTVEDSIADTSYSWPSTMYIVLPGVVKRVHYYGKVVPPDGVEIAAMYGSTEPDTGDSQEDSYNADWNFKENQYRGTVDQDYVTYYYQRDGLPDQPYYYVVASAGEKVWSDPIIITAQIPLANTELIGGFLNVEDDSEHSDAGYVYLDAEGHLRLMDYGLIRQGTLAYQLGSDYTGSGMSLADLQADLDDKVNERVAFLGTKSKPDESNIVNVTIEIPDEDAGGTIDIRGIDSRFNTSVYLHILGDGNSKTTIRIIDCEKIMIDNALSGKYNIELYRSNLYYDGAVIDRLSKIDELGLWYEQFSSDDPDIVVDGLTVKELGAGLVTKDVDYWDMSHPNDTHYEYALESISFNRHGDIVGVGIYMRDSSTRSEIPVGRNMYVADFTLPHGSRLTYPISRFVNAIDITGTFVSSYLPSNEDSVQAYTANIDFAIVINPYDSGLGTTEVSGRITICEDNYIINAIGGDISFADDGTANIPGVNVGTLHIFRGGVIG